MEVIDHSIPTTLAPLRVPVTNAGFVKRVAGARNLVADEITSLQLLKDWLDIGPNMTIKRLLNARKLRLNSGVNRISTGEAGGSLGIKVLPKFRKGKGLAIHRFMPTLTEGIRGGS